MLDPDGDAVERIFEGVRLSDMISLGLVDRRMFGGIVADIPPGENTADHRAEASHNEGQPPRAEFCDEARNDQGAERRTERSAAVEERGAARAFVDAIQIAFSLPPAG